MKKRITGILLACLVVAALAGCSKKAETVTPASTIAETQETAEEVVETEESKETNTTDAFVPFEDPNGMFTLSYPGTPEENRQTVPVAGTSIEMISYFLQMENCAYNLSYSDYPEGVMGDSSVMLDTAIAGLPSEVEESTDITLGDYMGKEVKFSTQSGDTTVTFFQRVYIVGDRMYQLQAMNDSGERTPDVDVFFDSFALTEQEKHRTTKIPHSVDMYRQ